MSQDELSPAVTLEGGCLCGAVQVTLFEARPGLDICHCAMCRRWGGPFIGVSGKRHEVSGEDNVTAYRSSNWAQRAFCKTCGSNLWFDFLPGNHRGFLTGLFDLPASFTIREQIFIDHKPENYDILPPGELKTGEQVIAEAEAAGFTFG